MDNLRLAWLLEEAAQLMEIRGDNPFKIRAFENGARITAALPASYREMLRSGDLAKTKGIGKGLLAEIEGFDETGTLPSLVELQKEVPPGVAEFLRVPGVGPKMARQFFRELNVTSIDELAEAAKARKIRELKGLGGKTEMAIVRGIERMRQRSGRTSIAIAKPLADEILAVILGLPGVQCASIAGSLRRAKDTVKDLDFLVASSDARSVISVFTTMPCVQEVTAHGDSKASVVFHAGLAGDLRVIAPTQFGGGLHYFTGSKAHNIRMRQWAKEKGYSLSEYGLTDLKSGKTIECATEEDLFRSLDLEYIPPQLREDRGEIEAAANATLPDLVSIESIQGDLHMHTRYSDGVNSIKEMAEAARERGRSYIAICDHSQSLKIANGMSEARLREQHEEIRRVSETIGFPILAGVECDILADGSLDYEDEILAKLDFVVASIHSGFRQEEHQLTERLLKAISNPYVDMIGHPTGRMLGQRDAYPIDIEVVVRAAKEHRKILEINATPERLDLNDAYAALCRETGVPVAINTDAHRPEHMDYMEYGVRYASRAWLTNEHVANAWPLERLLAYRGRLERAAPRTGDLKPEVGAVLRNDEEMR